MTMTTQGGKRKRDSESSDETNLHEITQLRKMGLRVTEDLLGKGGYSRVYKSYVTENGNSTLAACKIIIKNPHKDDLDVSLEKELKILKCLHHENIIRLYKSVESDQFTRVFIFMEFCPSDLVQYLEANPVVPEEQARVVFQQILLAIFYLHSKNIAHRDIKCDNILLSENGQVKLADFGFATYCLNEKGEHRLSTNFCRSDAYASPELLAFTPYYPKMADMWASGVVLFSMLDGCMPFYGNPETQYKQQTQKSARYRTKGLSEDVKILTQSLMEPNVFNRITRRLEEVYEYFQKHINLITC